MRCSKYLWERGRGSRSGCCEIPKCTGWEGEGAEGKTEAVSQEEEELRAQAEARGRGTAEN